jgi:hypothetical protein
MKVSIENIGLVKKAEYVLTDLNIFCGDNNTGKTWVIYAFYGFLKFINSKNSLDDFEKHNIHKLELAINLPELNNKKEILITLDQSLLNVFLEIYCEEFSKAENLSSVFNISIEHFKHSKFKLNKTLGKLYDDDFSIEINLGRFFKYNIKKIGVNQLGIYLKEEKSGSNKLKTLYKTIQKDFMQDVINIVMNIIFNDGKFNNPRKSATRFHMISTERTGAAMFLYDIEQSEKQLQMQNMFQFVTKSSDQDNSTPEPIKLLKAFFEIEHGGIYPLPIKNTVDFIKIVKQDGDDGLLTRFRTKQTRKSWKKKDHDKFAEILTLFHEIAGGKYFAKEGMIHFKLHNDNSNNDNLDFNVSVCSSTSRSLVQFNYYLKYIADIGDILIIDEPELNLHPKRQILMARLLTMISNFGITVVLSTHSDILVREFSALIMLSNKKKRADNSALITQYHYLPSQFIQAAQVSLYNIVTNKDNVSTVIRETINIKSAINSDNFNSAIDQQNSVLMNLSV